MSRSVEQGTQIWRVAADGTNWQPVTQGRLDLDAQIWKTFHACGKKVVQAESGKHLMELIRDPANEIITTVI